MEKTKLESEIITFIADYLCEVCDLEKSDISIQKPFTEYGVSSVEAINLSADLEAYLGTEVEPTAVWDYPSIQLMATALAEQITLATKTV
ncbi:acyl carrier protein [Glaciimonas sp. GG7]